MKTCHQGDGLIHTESDDSQSLHSVREGFNRVSRGFYGPLDWVATLD